MPFHRKLQALIEKVKTQAKKFLVTVHHDGNTDQQVLDQIKKKQEAGEHHWWEIFLDGCPFATGLFLPATVPGCFVVVFVGCDVCKHECDVLLYKAPLLTYTMLSKCPTAAKAFVN